MDTRWDMVGLLVNDLSKMVTFRRDNLIEIGPWNRSRPEGEE